MLKNVPWSVVFGDDFQQLTNAERVAFLIMIGQLEGGEFDWGSLKWKKK